MTPFEFATAGRIVFGRGKAGDLSALVAGLGRRALVVLGGSGRGGEALTSSLKARGIDAVRFLVPGEPTTTLVDEATDLARREGCDLVIALGGGSVIDAGKAVAGMATNPGLVLDYLELVGGGQSLKNRGLPFVAAPTTAGTGTEVTKNAVLDVPEHRVKASLRSPFLLATLAVIDPELTLTMPPQVTAMTGMDALTQLIEPFVSVAANPLTDGLCREGMARASRGLLRAHRDGGDIDAREDMSIAALCGGLALANAKLGAVHGFAGVLGGLTGHAHGALCARLLPFVLDTNLRAIQARGTPAQLARFDEVARILLGTHSAKGPDVVGFVHDLGQWLAIPTLTDAGLTPDDIPRVVPLAKRASSMQGNPLPLNDDELARILREAL